MCELVQPPPGAWHPLAEIERVLSAKGIAYSKFGRKYAGDARFVKDLRNGRELRPESRYAIWTYLHEEYGDILKCALAKEL